MWRRSMMPERSFRTFLYWAALAVLPASLTAQGKPVAPPPGFDAFVAQVMKQFEVPGMAVAIVKDGKVVLAKGYGVTHRSTPRPVSESPPTPRLSPRSQSVFW